MEERRKDGELLERVVRLETQMGRLISHVESEKGTQQRVAESIDKRFVVSEERVRKLEHTIWLAAGAVSVIVMLANMFLKHL